MNNTGQITQLLREWRNGEDGAGDRLMTLVYEQLRVLASRSLAAENPGHTLNATALVHEAFLRLNGAAVDYQDRIHFYSVAARVLRRVLIDHARGRQRVKRGNNPFRLEFDDAVLVTNEAPETLIAVHEALDHLTAIDERKAHIVELIYFGGLDHDGAAQVLRISPATLRRDLRLARAWLVDHLQAPNTQRAP